MHDPNLMVMTMMKMMKILNIQGEAREVMKLIRQENFR